MRADLLVPLVLCVVYVPVVEASAADLFVSPEGDDAGPGTKERPWRTIQHAADSAAPGDTIHIGAGSYNQGVSLARSGSPDQPITFLALQTMPLYWTAPTCGACRACSRCAASRTSSSTA